MDERKAIVILTYISELQLRLRTCLAIVVYSRSILGIRRLPLLMWETVDQMVSWRSFIYTILEAVEALVTCERNYLWKETCVFTCISEQSLKE